jgi:pyruvate/2-oxoglutarate dehydrogenase complex dihydrolipoamide acyltransferase (E2) component
MPDPAQELPTIDGAEIQEWLDSLDAASVLAPPPLQNFEKWGPIERTAMRSVRRVTAERMTSSWWTVPHVTQHDRADITHFESTRGALKREAPDVKLTATALAVKVAAAALREFPQFNASFDSVREEIVYKRYVHIGVAVDTDRGLLVPVVRDADRKTLRQLSAEIPVLAEKARAKRLTSDEMDGAPSPSRISAGWVARRSRRSLTTRRSPSSGCRVRRASRCSSTPGSSRG